MPAVRTSPFPTLESLGPYEILTTIASGGMATVYLARKRGVGGFDREVALKVIHPHLQVESSGVDETCAQFSSAASARMPSANGRG
ncbi:MAG: hypothetical protein NVSMB1_21700 [Polyangiales bacterium]